MKTIVIHFARLGPYHLARLESAVEVLGELGWRVVAMETAGSDATYEWERTEGGSGFERRTVFPDRVFEEIEGREMRRGIYGVLDELRPEAVAVAGWGTADARACLAWCRRNEARAVVMSETREVDGRRVWWREWVKARIVRRFQGGLCGGESHRRYLVRLGMRPETIALGYNVVDNGFFSGKRNEYESRPIKGPYFLASNRFVARKNLARLVCAYALYGRRSAGRVWPLVLLGDGEMRGVLEELCGELGVAAGSGAERGEVVFAGFRQIGELRDFYAGAGAFVHPALEEPWGLVVNEAMASGLPVVSSRNVGAAEELVVEGETGFLFDPEDVEGLAGLLVRVAGMREAERLAMGVAARDMVDRKVPKRAFGEGLAKVVAR